VQVRRQESAIRRLSKLQQFYYAKPLAVMTIMKMVSWKVTRRTSALTQLPKGTASKQAKTAETNSNDTIAPGAINNTDANNDSHNSDSRNNGCTCCRRSSG
jgi:hypothetical protein